MGKGTVISRRYWLYAAIANDLKNCKDNLFFQIYARKVVKREPGRGNENEGEGGEQREFPAEKKKKRVTELASMVGYRR